MRKSETQQLLRAQIMDITIKVKEVSRQFKFKVKGSTLIKELCNRISELLDLDPIKTYINFIPQFCVEELNHSKSLLQNNISNNAVLFAKILYTSKKSSLTTVFKTISRTQSFRNELLSKSTFNMEFAGYSTKTNTAFFGLKVVGICTNPTCIAYNKEVTVPMGYKTFDVNTIMKKTICQNCPYKYFDMQKPITVTNLILTNCFWRLEGHFYDSSGFYNYSFMKNWIKTEGCNTTIFFQRLNEKKYVDPQLIIRAL